MHETLSQITYSKVVVSYYQVQPPPNPNFPPTHFQSQPVSDPYSSYGDYPPPDYATFQPQPSYYSDPNAIPPAPVPSYGQSSQGNNASKTGALGGEGGPGVSSVPTNLEEKKQKHIAKKTYQAPVPSYGQSSQTYQAPVPSYGQSSQEPPPSRKRAYSTMIQEEEEVRCTHCKKRFHTEENCWEKHGYPSRGRGRGRGRRGGGRGSGRGGRGHTNTFQAAHASASTETLTSQEVNQLRKLLNAKSEGSSKSTGMLTE